MGIENEISQKQEPLNQFPFKNNQGDPGYKSLNGTYHLDLSLGGYFISGLGKERKLL